MINVDYNEMLDKACWEFVRQYKKYIKEPMPKAMINYRKIMLKETIEYYLREKERQEQCQH